MSQPKLIVIDDEIGIAGFVGEVATQAGFDVTQFNNASIFKEKFNKGNDVYVDVIILDLIMPGVDGIEIIRYLAEIKCDALLILMSGFDSGVLHSAQTLASEHGLNFAGSLSKPFRASELGELLNSLYITPKKQHGNSNIEPPPVEELRDAISNNELVVYYQPKVSLSNETVTAVEALVRWPHPVHGLIGPDLFVPTAEQNGLIDELTWAVLEQAMAQCMSWRDQGIVMQLAVNMSAKTLKELDLPERMGQIIQKYDLEPSQLMLEITETMLMQELVKSLDILTRLRMKGIHLSIDDFGTGYSSLVQLHRAPFSEIKIDRSFVSEMETDSEAAAIVETIIMLGHKLNMKTVAEGVETASCQKKLAALGCDQAQGYLFSRPLPADKVFSWFSSRVENE